MLGMWTVFGVLIGVVTRSPAVGLGLVWSLVVENLLRLFSGRRGVRWAGAVVFVLRLLGALVAGIPATASGLRRR